MIFSAYGSDCFGFSFEPKRSRFALLWDMAIATYSEEIPTREERIARFAEYCSSAYAWNDAITTANNLIREKITNV